MISELNRAYTAGLFDGEGCITIARHLRRAGYGYQLSITVHMCDDEPLRLLCKQWGGVVRDRKPNNGSSRPSFRWRLYSGQAQNFLQDIRPYLQIERVQIKADLAVEFQAQKKIGGEWKGYSEKQRHYYEVMRDLNRRGATSLNNSERARIADLESQLRLVA